MTVLASSALADAFVRAWERTDRLFALVGTAGMLARPIALRLPFIFYVGHLPAFAWNHICRGVVGRPPFEPYFDEVFDRGIDPDVDHPEICHDHPDIPDVWPNVDDVVAYRDRVREAVLDALPDLGQRARTDVMADRDRVAWMVLEHELMHQETLLYMMQQLPVGTLSRPDGLRYPQGAGARPRAVDVRGGVVTLGADFEQLPFGWDNEFPRTTASVADFTIDALPVTNAEFLAFIEDRGYDRAELWTEADWVWRQRVQHAHPSCWRRAEGGWVYRTLFDELPLVHVPGWPVYVSLAEARAYARWAGKRLPTEAEIHRAAYGAPDDRERSYPWGDDTPAARHGNLDFVSWSPEPVGSRPDGASAWGVQELVGNGWELTDTPFMPFPGFRPYIDRYPGYSADFFDGKHYVIKGASWATDARLTRPSFRNWYQVHYTYMFAKFRCVQ